MQLVDYTLVLEVRDRPGVLVRIAHVFARRNCNIRSLHVQPHGNNGWSTMTISVRNVARISQIIRQLEKLIDVATVNAHKTVKIDKGEAVYE